MNKIKALYSMIFINKELIMGEKILLIDFVTYTNGFPNQTIYLPNETLARDCSCTTRSITSYIKSLKEKGYIEVLNINNKTREIKILKL